MLAQSTSKNLLFIYSVICDQTVKSDLLGVFLANSSMFPNPFLLAVLLSHSCRRSPPGHSALALSQYKVICLRTFTLCSVQCCKTRNSLYFPWYRVSDPEAWGQQYLKKRFFPQVFAKNLTLLFSTCFDGVWKTTWFGSLPNPTAKGFCRHTQKLEGITNTCCAALCLTLALWARLQSCIKCRVSSQL